MNVESKEGSFVQDYKSEQLIQLNGGPRQEGNLMINENEKRILVEDKEFIVAANL